MGINCPPGAICSDPFQERVGANQTVIYGFTSTKVTQGPDGKVNGGATTFNYSPSPGNYVPAATTTDGGKTWTYLNGSDGKPVLGADAKKSLEQGALKSTLNKTVIPTAAKKAGIPDPQAKNLQLNNNTANPSGAPTSTPIAPTSDTGEAAKGTKTTNFGNFTYPADLGSTKQDVIKFTILEYQPGGFGQQTTEGGTNLLQLNQRKTNRKPQGTVTLPIPSGISDTNACNWKTDELDAGKAALGAAAFSGISQGIGKMFENISTTVPGAVPDAKTAATSVFAAAASGGDNRSILARAEGVIVNPNMELLFDGPTLRPFSFTFKMSARNKGEAKTIIDIIRFFKRGMAPIKTDANLFLKTPNTFKIEYLHRQEKNHPFIGRIKECALQSFTTNYTPEGQYATYTDGVMVSYEIQMQFTELEPVFNSDYDDESNYPKVKDGIGF